MIYGPQYGRSYCPVHPDRIPGQVPLPYVNGGRRTLIAVFVLSFHAALIVVPMIFMAVTDMLNPPVYVMRLPTVDSIPNENPDMSPHPSPLNKKSTGTPDRGKPLTDIPEIPDLVKPVEPPKPQQVQTKEKPPEPVPDTKKTIPVKNVPKQKPRPKNTLLSAEQIKVSTKRVKNPARTSTPLTPPRQNQVSAADRARAARRAEAARALRSMTGETGGTGTPGGGGGPRGIYSKEVSDYYNKVEAFLKRQWQQPSLYNSDRLKVLVLFKVDKTGRVLNANIVERSGVAAMDSSVEQLIRSLRALPAPPQAMQFTVTMEIDR